MRKLICGKYDSLYKKEFNVQTMKYTGKLERGFFQTAMQYACKVCGGVKAIKHIRNQPWETWQKYGAM